MRAPGFSICLLLPLRTLALILGLSVVPGTVLSGSGSAPVQDIPGVIRHGPRNTREIALTFDACSSRRRGKLDTAVARTLILTRTAATVFLGGKWASDVSTALRPLIADSLLEFGDHAYMHPHLIRLSDDSVRGELRRAQRVLTQLTGKRPVLFRAPYGEVDARVAAVAKSLGLTVIQYDLPSGDPDPNLSPQSIVRYVVSQARGGSIIVMHINTRGWHTAETLPEIIEGLRKRGFTFVTVSRLLARKSRPGM
jgi:peptidoglycan/xylan/chitin deacetylase (PgdA/CDA1 family)